jgi:dihydroorotate dehydrogenase (fumarate)/dihydroorotate dehydrogenase
VGTYRRAVRPLLFRTDPEWIHDRSIRLAELAGSSAVACRFLSGRYAVPDERLAVEVAGLRFAGPVGLGAGFDKNARAVPLLSSLGFGHLEIGSVSARMSDGNARPRLFRLIADQAIVVHYGVPNDGAQRVARRMEAVRDKGRRTIPVGLNIVNTNHGPHAPVEPDDAVIADYVESVRRLHDVADYLCLNLSCPNTRDGQSLFHDPRRLADLLAAIGQLHVTRPVFLKVAPFPGTREMELFLETATTAQFVAGFSVNLPAARPAGMSTPARALDRLPGAVSGAPAAAAADRTIRDLYQRLDPTRHAVIGSGGVFTAVDAYRKIRLGASLVQVLTSLVYEGPGVARDIHAGLAALLERDGFHNVSEAVGADS